jgi:hypothetical protein
MQLTAFLDMTGVRWRWGNKRQVQACCPFTGCNDTKYRLGINLDKKAAHCFNCGWHGSVFKLTKELRGEFVRLDGLGTGDDTNTPVAIDLPEEFTPLADVERAEFGLGALLDYVLRRGLTMDDIKRYHVGGAVSGKFSDRVIFPVFYGTTLFTYLGRTIHKAVEPRYLNAKKATRAVWGLEPALEHPSGWLTLSEGVLKAIAMGRVVGGCSGAVLGSQLSEFQLDQVEEAGYTNVLFIPDPGVAGLAGAVATSDALVARGIHVWYPWPLPEAQADEVNEDRRREWVASAIPYTRAGRWKLLRELGR